MHFTNQLSNKVCLLVTLVLTMITQIVGNDLEEAEFLDVITEAPECECTDLEHVVIVLVTVAILGWILLLPLVAYVCYLKRVFNFERTKNNGNYAMRGGIEVKSTASVSHIT